MIIDDSKFECSVNIGNIDINVQYLEEFAIDLDVQEHRGKVNNIFQKNAHLIILKSKIDYILYLP